MRSRNAQGPQGLFHVISGHWVSCPRGHALLFRYLTLRIWWLLFKHAWNLLLSVPICTRSPSHSLVPNLQLPHSQQAFPFPGTSSGNLGVQKELSPCPPFLPETHLQVISVDTGHRGSYIKDPYQFSCDLTSSNCAILFQSLDALRFFNCKMWVITLF